MKTIKKIIYKFIAKHCNYADEAGCSHCSTRIRCFLPESERCTFSLFKRQHDYTCKFHNLYKGAYDKR